MKSAPSRIGRRRENPNTPLARSETMQLFNRQKTEASRADYSEKQPRAALNGHFSLRRRKADRVARNKFRAHTPDKGGFLALKPRKAGFTRLKPPDVGFATLNPTEEVPAPLKHTKKALPIKTAHRRFRAFKTDRLMFYALKTD